MLDLVPPSFARFGIAMKLGIAIAARMPMITTTIISSISVKPFSALFMVLTAPRRLVAIVATASVMIVVQPICRRKAHGVPGVGPAVTLAASGSRLPGRASCARKMQRAGISHSSGSWETAAEPRRRRPGARKTRRGPESPARDPRSCVWRLLARAEHQDHRPSPSVALDVVHGGQRVGVAGDPGHRA